MKFLKRLNINFA